MYFLRVKLYFSVIKKMRPPAALLTSLFASFSHTPNPPTYRLKRVRATFAHDTAAFTQGLYFEPDRGTLVESTGLYGASSIRRVDIRSGRVLESEPLPDAWFGEGVAPCGDGLALQLLWRERLCLVRDAATLALKHTLPLPRGMREGWGLTHDGAGALYASDGSATLHVLSSHFSGDTLKVERTVRVTAGSRPLELINELQWIRGEIWANVFRQERIAVIDPHSGVVRCFVDCSGLLSAAEHSRLGFEEVLNGIAHDEARDRLYVTGKCWPKLFEVEVEDAAALPTVAGLEQKTA